MSNEYNERGRNLLNIVVYQTDKEIADSAPLGCGCLVVITGSILIAEVIKLIYNNLMRS